MKAPLIRAGLFDFTLVCIFCHPVTIQAVFPGLFSGKVLSRHLTWAVGTTLDNTVIELYTLKGI